MLVATVAALTPGFVKSRRPYPRAQILIDAAVLVLATLSAGMVYRSLVGGPGGSTWPWQAVPIGAAVVVYHLVQRALAEIVVPLLSSQPVNRSWLKTAFRGCPGYLLGASVAVAQTQRVAGAIGAGASEVWPARGFSLVWSGEGIRTFTSTGSRPIQEHEPTLFEIWVCADGYWCDHTKNLVPGDLTERYAELEQQLLGVYGAAIEFCRPGASLAELDRMIREGIAGMGYPGQPSHPICHGVGARAHEPPYAHQAGAGTIEAGMVLAIEPGVYWPEGGGLRVEDNFLITQGEPERLCRFPDGIVRAGS